MSDEGQEELRLLSQRLEQVASAMLHSNITPPPNDTDNETMLDRWFNYIGIGWKVVAVIVLGTIGWANLNNDISNIKKNALTFEQDIKADILQLTTKQINDLSTVNTEINRNVRTIYADLERESANIQKDIKYADLVLDTKIETLKQDNLNTIASAKKDILDTVRNNIDNLSSELTGNSVAVTQLLYRFEAHAKKADESLSLFPETLALNIKILNEKIDKVDNSLDDKIETIIKDRIQNKVEQTNFINEFNKIASRVEEMERTLYRKEKKK